MSETLSELIGQVLVFDLGSPYVCIGRLSAVHADYLVLNEVDVHDLRDTNKTREKYVWDSRALGVTPNRKRAWLNRSEIVCVSRLDDVEGAGD